MVVYILFFLFVLTVKSPLLVSCNWYRLAVNFDNIWTRQKWHILNPPVNKET